MQYPLAQELNVPGYQKVIRFEVPSLQLKGFIAIHNTFRGPALGGTRLWHYDNESLALKDVLRLAEGMTYKAAATQLPLGGGKAVLIGQPSIKSKAYFQAYGYYVNSLNGQYITAEDVNTNTEDMASILLSTPHVVGLRNKSGNPSPWTALGAFKGIQASIQYLWHEKKIEQCRFAIQGVGATGLEVIHHLVKAGVTSITIADINPLHLEQATKLYPRVRVVDSKLLLFEPVDVLVPCALGGILNQNTIPKIKAQIIAGTANNLLENYEVDKQLINQQGILLAPDFIINAGGLIHVSKEVTKENDKQTIERLNQIGPRLLAIYELAKHKKISTFQAATLYASQHFQ